MWLQNIILFCIILVKRKVCSVPESSVALFYVANV